MTKQPAKKTVAKKTAAKKTTAKKVAAKKAAPKKKQPAKKAVAPKKDAVKKAYAKLEAVAEEHGIDVDAYEDKAIEIIDDFSYKAEAAIEEISNTLVAEISKQKKGLLKKLFFWLKK